MNVIFLNVILAYLLSARFDGHLLDLHREDLETKSGLSPATIAVQKFRSVPHRELPALLQFTVPGIQSAYLIPFADVQRGGWLDFVRVKIFPAITTDSGTVKYLQRKRSGMHIYFPLATLDAVLHSDAPIYIVEGEKKSLAIAQRGYAAVGICGVEGWHLAGSSHLHPDLDVIDWFRREVRLLPDGDYRTNRNVRRAVQGLATALQDRGVATIELLRVPAPFKGVDDYLAAHKDTDR